MSGTGSHTTYKEPSITSGTAITDAIQLDGQTPAAIQTPAALTGTQFSFDCAVSTTGTFAPLYNTDGTEFLVDVGTSRHIWLDPRVFAGVRSIKIRSGTVGTPTNEAATRTIVLIVRDID